MSGKKVCVVGNMLGERRGELPEVEGYISQIEVTNGHTGGEIHCQNAPSSLLWTLS